MSTGVVIVVAACVLFAAWVARDVRRIRRRHRDELARWRRHQRDEP